MAAAFETRQSSATFHAEAANVAIAVASSRGSTSCIRSCRRTSRRDARNGDSPPRQDVRRIHSRARKASPTIASTEAPSATKSGDSSSTRLEDCVGVRRHDLDHGRGDGQHHQGALGEQGPARRRTPPRGRGQGGGERLPDDAQHGHQRAGQRHAVTMTAEATACGVTTNGV